MHSVPIFEGPRSRRHRDVPLWRLCLAAMPATLRHARHFAGADTFAQFVGFPRSGHTLVGSIIDAHPRAAIAHELDVMGLIEEGVPPPFIRGLIARNAGRFARDGRWWNGFSYAIPNSSHEAVRRPIVIGDKKGDWAVRRCRADASLLGRARMVLGKKDRWILVVRHPADNIATMSLRVGRVYDELRIRHRSSEFSMALQQAQAQGRVAAMASDEAIDDYEGLCLGIERMRREIPGDRWHTLVYEDFAARPLQHVRELYGFLGLPLDEVPVSSAAEFIKPARSRSRERIGWHAAQEDRVRAIIDRFEFLSPYRSE